MAASNQNHVLSDGTGVNLKSVIAYAKAAQLALEEAGDSVAAMRFECFADYLMCDVANGKPFKFSSRSLGL